MRVQIPLATLVICQRHNCREVIGRMNKDIRTGYVYCEDIDQMFINAPIYSTMCPKCGAEFLVDGRVHTQDGWRP